MITDEDVRAFGPLRLRWPRTMTADEIAAARLRRAPFVCDDAPAPDPRRSRTALGSGVVALPA